MFIVKIQEILDNIKLLAKSQGFYGRLYRDIMEMKTFDPKMYDKWVEFMESQNFETPVDLVLFFECPTLLQEGAVLLVNLLGALHQAGIFW